MLNVTHLCVFHAAEKTGSGPAHILRISQPVVTKIMRI
jgi:hypothetical protein